MNRARDVLLEFEKYKANAYLTHGFHPYPAKFIPQIPRELIQRLSSLGDRVIDPFCGSGTSLVEAMLLGRPAVGVDVNPLSTLVTRVKTAELSREQCRSAMEEAMVAGKLYKMGHRAEIPRFDGIDHWFTSQVQRELAVIRSSLFKVEDIRVREFLLVALSAILTKVSNQDSDTRYTAIEKGIRPGDASRYFLRRVEESIQRMQQFVDENMHTSAEVILEDAATVRIAPRSVDLVVTSPPYMNSYDYYLYHKHRMNWLGLEYREAQAKEIGSRNKHNDKGLGIDAYNDPIAEVFGNLLPALKRHAYIAVVIGDAILRGELVKMNKNFDSIMAKLGLAKVREIVFPQRKYTKSFTPNLRTRHKDSYVLIYQG